ncbi:hypothetical protein ACFP3Q_01130 [Nocardioides sp. GCM10027113]|uniref:hypothetical protein n=1 Tax=unclassified Nocardioides TaxID=2615069 RepID=UPI003615FA6D
MKTPFTTAAMRTTGRTTARTTKLARAGVAAGLLTALAGCGGDDASPAAEGPTAIEMPVSGNSLLVAGTPDEVGDVRFEGTPRFVNGCLGAEAGSAEGLKNYLVVWPDGTTVAGAEDDSLVLDGDVLEPGSSFVGKGIEVSGQPFPDEFPDIPIRCLGPNQENIWWVQEIEEITE